MGGVIFDSPNPEVEHHYLSTACLHGRHDYCRSEVKLDGTGPKRPGRCKFCPALCTCPCHQRDGEQ